MELFLKVRSFFLSQIWAFRAMKTLKHMSFEHCFKIVQAKRHVIDCDCAEIQFAILLLFLYKGTSRQ